jgi:hypothetical protein
MSVSYCAHDPSARYAGTSPSRNPRRGGMMKHSSSCHRDTLYRPSRLDRRPARKADQKLGSRGCKRLASDILR